MVPALLTIHDVDTDPPLSAVFGLESDPRGHVGYSVTSSFSAPPPPLLVNSTFQLFGCSLFPKLCHSWQAPLGNLERGKFLEWTIISSVWGNSVTWKRVDCCWRVAPMMVRLNTTHRTTLHDYRWGYKDRLF